MIFPDDMSFEGATTLPTAFVTGLYALGHIAHGRAGDRVLIHSSLKDIGIDCIRFGQSLGIDAFAFY